MDNPFTEQDKAQLEQHGIALENATRQLELLNKPQPMAPLERTATISDGIKQFSPEELQMYSRLWEKQQGKKKVVKFVPASGAASRMFKHLHEQKGELAEEFFQNLNSFPFIKELEEENTREEITEHLLGEDGLNFAHLPKALIPFHAYGKEVRTALEEHFVEGVQYAQGKTGLQLHFTISKEHEELFNQKVTELKQKYWEEVEEEIEVTYSFQQPASDAVAATLTGEPFRTEDGTLLIRPAGHGALLHNLNDIAADIIYIKNIDNVQPEHLRKDTVQYKKALGGYLLALEQILRETLLQLEKGTIVIQALVPRLNSLLGTNIAEDISQDDLFELLNRPIRVCGMVKNEGEPGGGPFWVQGEAGASLQIVEKSQVDMDNAEQVSILQSATHFNPVDLVCFTKDYKGQPFDLTRFVDDNTYLITNKSYQGQPLKAFELPGLWNGSMAGWTTIFVEVPLSTFSPVKTVNDLLKPQHQTE